MTNIGLWNKSFSNTLNTDIRTEHRPPPCKQSKRWRVLQMSEPSLSHQLPSMNPSHMPSMGYLEEREEKHIRNAFSFFILEISDKTCSLLKLTKIDDFQCSKKTIFKLQVLRRCFGAVVFDERESTSSKDVVVRSLHLPVEVGQTELVIDDVTVAHAERCPGRERALCEVTC